MDGSGYAVAARIGRVKPRVAGHAAAHDSRDQLTLLAAAEVALVNDRVPDATDDSPALDEVLGDRWSAFRDRWSQLTFYLFDAESWR